MPQEQEPSRLEEARDRLGFSALEAIMKGFREAGLEAAGAEGLPGWVPVLP